MHWKEDKTLIVLCFFSIFYTIILLFVAWWKPNDASIWQLFSGMLTGFIGALSLHLKTDKGPAATTITTTATTNPPTTTTTATNAPPEQPAAPAPSTPPPEPPV